MVAEVDVRSSYTDLTSMSFHTEYATEPNDAYEYGTQPKWSSNFLPPETFRELVGSM